jgi:uncharacterized protein (DUF983 family)
LGLAVTAPTTPVGSLVPVASPGRMLVRGAMKRCARCGSGRLFRRWTQMVPDCPRCGYHFEREEGFFLGALIVNIALTEGLIILIIAIGFGVTLPDPPLVTLATIAAVGAVAMPLLAYPFTKTLWTAIDIIMLKSLGESYRDRGHGPRQPGLGDRSGSIRSGSDGTS